jgi:C-3',4' desaturase CrtD
MYHTIIIGAGVAGLTLGALLARAGRSVLVLEGHTEPGGCASSFRRKRPDGSSYVFDVGATLFGGFQPGGAHHWVAQRLGVRFPVLPLEPAMQVHLPDRAITRWGDPAQWAAERQRMLPEQAQAAEQFWRNQEALADIAWRFAARYPPVPPETPGDLLRLLPAIRPELLGLLPHLGRTVGHELRRYRLTDRALHSFLDAQLLISAQVPAEQCAWLFGSVALDLARQGVYYVAGGAWNIAHTLADALLRDGGELRYRTPVETILVRDGITRGVQVRGGETIPARHVVTSSTIWNLPHLLGEATPPALLRRSQRLTPGWGAFTLYLGIDEAGIPSGLAEHHQVVQNYSAPLGEGNSAFISLHPAADTNRAPAGQRAVTISTHTRPEPWFTARATDRAAYLERKHAYSERLLAALDRALPGARAQIRYQQAGTPVSFQRYTRRLNGAVGGIAQLPQQSGFQSLGVRVPGIARLWLVGDSVFPGQSTAAVTQSAIRLYKLLVG